MTNTISLTIVVIIIIIPCLAISHRLQAPGVAEFSSGVPREGSQQSLGRGLLDAHGFCQAWLDCLQWIHIGPFGNQGEHHQRWLGENTAGARVVRAPSAPEFGCLHIQEVSRDSQINGYGASGLPERYYVLFSVVTKLNVSCLLPEGPWTCLEIVGEMLDQNWFCGSSQDCLHYYRTRDLFLRGGGANSIFGCYPRTSNVLLTSSAV